MKYEVNTNNDNEKQTKDNQDFMETKGDIVVSDMLKEIGIPASLKGYKFLKIAIKMCLSHPDQHFFMTKDVYPKIAYIVGNTTAQRVERAIRHSIEVAFTRNPNAEARFGNTIDPRKGKPTNSEFLAEVTEMIRLKLVLR